MNKKKSKKEIEKEKKWVKSMSKHYDPKKILPIRGINIYRDYPQ